MLEVKNLYKTYKSKKSTSCVAVNDINIRFPDKGMVFILGKSGSGKSTLLNVIGGLDAPDKGEIVIMGKSSKSFSASDYDSYRNTYLGFIFQEYNIMDDFSVFDNIALALRLQNKKAEKENVEKILKQVGLDSLEKRKPNELSGGQKQRVAIARALVKDPRIIFGDEPTGNLDSKTSSQIFELLKKLSREKLIVIVSHDKESAEKYADRIIELSDGKVINDITRKNTVFNKVEIKNNEIFVPENKILTSKEIKDINKNIELSNGKAKLKIVKSSYVKTQEKDSNITEKFKLIKSKLPTKFATQIGVSNFAKKKFRTVVTIFLTVIALAMFGLSQTFGAYDLVEASTSSFLKNNITNIVFKKGEVNEEYGSFNFKAQNNIDSSIISKIESAIDGEVSKGYNIKLYLEEQKSFIDLALNYMTGTTLSSPSVTNSGGVVLISEEMLKNYFADENGNVSYILGAYPTEQNGGFLITDYLADVIIRSDVSIFDRYESYQDFLTYGITDIYFTNVRVVGIIDTGYKTKYRDLLDSYSVNANNFTQHNDYESFQNEAINYLSQIFARKSSDISTLATSRGNVYFSGYKFKKEVDQEFEKGMAAAGYAINSQYVKIYAAASGVNLNTSISLGENFETTLNASSSNIIVPVSVYNKLFATTLKASDGFVGFEEQTVTFGSFGEFLTTKTPNSVYNLTIVGVYSLGDNMTSTFIASNDFVESANQPLVKALYLELPESRLELKELLTIANDNLLYHITEISDSIFMVSNIFNIFAVVFRWIALILGVFSVILLFNFVSLSVLNKKKEIGILRAIGTRGFDVSKIFLIEALIVSAITTVFAIALMFLGTYGVNALLITNFKEYMQSNAIERIALLQIGIIPIVAVIFACLLITFIATIIPTVKISRMKPVDAIKRAN